MCNETLRFPASIKLKNIQNSVSLMKLVENYYSIKPTTCHTKVMRVKHTFSKEEFNSFSNLQNARLINSIVIQYLADNNTIKEENIFKTYHIAYVQFC